MSKTWSQQKTNRLALLNQFPEKCELHLVMFFNLGYILFLNPFKFVYDEKLGEYILKLSLLRQVVCILRILGLVHQLLYFKLPKLEMEVTIPGPIKAFNSAFAVGSVSIGIVFFAVMNFSRTRRDLLNLINLLISESKTYRLTPNHLAKAKTKKLVRHKSIDFIIHVCIMVALFSSFFFKHFSELGIKRFILITWQRASNQKMKHGWDPSDTVRKGVRHFKEMTWWMKAITLLILFAELDSETTVAATLGLIFFLTRILHSVSNHLIENQVAVGKFCVISTGEVLHQYRKLQKVIILASRSFTLLTGTFVFTFFVNTCVAMIIMFKDSNWGSIVVLIIAGTYFGWTLVAAAEVVSDMKRMVHTVISNTYSGYPVSSSCPALLQKNILTYEMGSGNLGFGLSNIFTVSFNFIGSIVLALLSNSMIVLQSYDFYAISRPPLPPLPPEE